MGKADTLKTEKLKADDRWRMPEKLSPVEYASHSTGRGRGLRVGGSGVRHEGEGKSVRGGVAESAWMW
jgi:hypothetical protein